MLATRFSVFGFLPAIIRLLLVTQLFLTHVHSLGGRKIAIVVDNSQSNDVTDPTGLRVDAARSVNDMLISGQEAGNGKEADRVCLVKFSGSAKVLYPLGDPGLTTGFEELNITEYGTWVGDGVVAGMNEVSGGELPTMNNTGMIVLTDGQDESDGGILLGEQLIRAAQSGIRVSFGFLSNIPFSASASYSSISTDLLAGVLQTGGIYGTINSAQAQKNFVQLVFMNGITDADRSRTEVTHPVLPGITVAGILPKDGASEIYTYSAIPNERLNFTVSVFDTAARLQVALLDLSKKTKLDVQVASGGLPVQISHVAPEDGNLAIVLSTVPGSSGSTPDSSGDTPGIYELTMDSSNPFRTFTKGAAPGKIGMLEGCPAVVLLMSIVYFVFVNSAGLI